MKNKKKDKFVRIKPETHRVLQEDASARRYSLNDYIYKLATGQLRPPKERTANATE